MVNQKFPARWRFQKGPPGQPARKIVHVLAPADAGGALAVRHRNADVEHQHYAAFARPVPKMYRSPGTACLGLPVETMRLAIVRGLGRFDNFWCCENVACHGRQNRCSLIETEQNVS